MSGAAVHGAWRAAVAVPLALLALSCTAVSPRKPFRTPMPDLAEPLARFVSLQPALRPFLSRAEELRVQIVVGEIVDGPAGRPILRQSGFRLDAEYFYPASAVKLFAAVAALERLAELRRESGLPLDADTPLTYHPLFADQQLERSDLTHVASGTITVGHEIRKLFLVSDNEAFNRLYELTGQDGLAASLARAELRSARLVHRLSVRRTPEENRKSPRIDFGGGAAIYSLPPREAAALPAPPPLAGLAVGVAHLDGETRVETPLDFTDKNRISLADLQRGLCQVVRPEVDCGGGFALGEADRRLLLESMGQVPRESLDPVYDPAKFPDHFVKFLLPGIDRVLPRGRFRVFDKIGRAYGFSTENAWIRDLESDRSFFLAATIYTNSDGVLNDDRYDYETVADPFFAALGEAAARWFWNVPLAEPAQPKKK